MSVCSLRLLMLQILAILLLFISVEARGSNNVHEDANLKVPELVKKYGYPIEIHQTITSDGYILTMHRIPRGRFQEPRIHRAVIFLMHGILCSSADFVIMGPGYALAYILADAGFDVWMGNARGNRYSRKHQTIEPNSSLLMQNFWDFSWDEIGNIDVPTMINYVLSNTGQQGLHYIGHSQGTTSFFVLCSLQPEYCNRIITMHALAPVAYLTNSTYSFIRAFSKYAVTAGRIATMMGAGEFLPNNPWMRWVGETYCADEARTQIICTCVMFLLFGWNDKQHNSTMMPVIMGHTPAGSSVNQVAHYGQVMSTGRFERYDYGSLQNVIHYASWNAPPYDLSKVTAPVYLYYSLDDPLANIEDVNRLAKELGNLRDKTIVPMGHVDFVYGIEAKDYIYDRIIRIIHDIPRRFK